MANSEHLAKLQEGAGVWNSWRKANPGIIPDLCGAELSNADLRYAMLGQAILSGANLGLAHLYGADLSAAPQRRKPPPGEPQLGAT
jgi:hypothetical protein